MIKSLEVCLVLHNLRSAHNVGAIFRTAEAAGVNKIYLTGYTSAPRDRFGRPNQGVMKSALGAEEYVQWEKLSSVGRLLGKLSRAGFQLIALEQAKQSTDYRLVKVSNSTAIIVGNEVSGLSQSILTKCQSVAEIPMRGRKESLNVAVATGIFLFRHFISDSAGKSACRDRRV
ncbi:MAG: TrmH family RNA methyltransferase [Patescibacteria group bacterium]